MTLRQFFLEQRIGLSMRLVVAISCVLIFPFAHAQELVILSEADDSYGRVENQIQKYLKKSRVIDSIRNKYGPERIYVGYAIEAVQTSVQDPEWPKHRVAAYRSALNEARLQYIQTVGLDIQTKSLGRLEQELGAPAPTAPDGEKASANKLGRILDKLGAVVEGNIDQTLQELDIDPDEFYSLPEKERRTRFKEAWVRTVTTKAIGSLEGLTPVQTFEGEGSDGSYSVGVVVIRTPATMRFVDMITQADGQVTPTDTPSASSIKEQVLTNRETLPTRFGLRIAVDQAGQPVLIAYGQWSNTTNAANDHLAAKYKSLALKQARQNAHQEIAEFLAGRINVQNESVIETLYEDYVETDSTGFVTQNQFGRLIDRLEQETRIRSNVVVTGLTDLVKWSSQHSYSGHQIVGVVRTWSPTSEKAARKVKGLGQAEGSRDERRAATGGAPADANEAGEGKEKSLAPILGGDELESGSY